MDWKREFTIGELVWQAIPHVQGIAGIRKRKILAKIGGTQILYRLIDGEVKYCMTTRAFFNLHKKVTQITEPKWTQSQLKKLKIRRKTMSYR